MSAPTTDAHDAASEIAVRHPADAPLAARGRVAFRDFSVSFGARPALVGG